MADHASPASSVAFRNCVRRCISNTIDDIRRLHGKSTIIIQKPIKRLCNTGEDEQIHLPLLVSTVLITIFQDPPIRIPYSSRRRQHHRTSEQTRLIDPVRPRQLAAAVEAEDAREGGEGCPVCAGEDGGYAGVDGWGWTDGLCVDEDAGHVR